MKKFLISLMIIAGTALFGADFEKPIILTSSGQSADVNMVNALIKKAGLECNFDKGIKAETLKDEKTLIVAIGGSSKGLGAAGIKVEDELDRTEKLLKAAKDKGMKIIGLHVGGEARRGELSDKFASAVAPNVDYLIVVEDGDKDGFFTKIATDKKIKIDKVPKISSAAEPLKKAFE